MSHALFTETAGSGPDLFLLHGWGMHGGIWDTLIPRFTGEFRVTRVDLPGHGHSAHIGMSAELGELARQVRAVAPAEAVWLGWSLGGLVALRTALDDPAGIRALVLSNTSPRFMTAADWPDAITPEMLGEFAAGLSADYRATLLRFLSLQLRGGYEARESLQELRDSLFARGQPDPLALAAGLAILKHSDLRAELERLQLPTLVLAGTHDRLTPSAAATQLAIGIAEAELQVFGHAAHVPFISHPKLFAEAVTEFMHSLGGAEPLPVA